MEKLSFRVAEFDAPLELILHLIQKSKLSIVDIDITSLLAQYLETIRSWQDKNLDIASEFLEMASHLVYIKTVSLLPRHEEERDRLHRELSGQLIEYRLCKLAAEQLGRQNMAQDVFVRPSTPIPADETYRLTHRPSELYAALTDALGRGARRLPPPRDSFEPLVARPVVSVTSKIFLVLRSLRHAGRTSLMGLFLQNTGRSGIVATFLALLELVKSGKVQIEDGEAVLSGSVKGGRGELAVGYGRAQH